MPFYQFARHMSTGNSPNIRTSDYTARVGLQMLLFIWNWTRDCSEKNQASSRGATPNLLVVGAVVDTRILGVLLGFSRLTLLISLLVEQIHQLLYIVVIRI